MLTTSNHPLLACRAFLTRFPCSLGAVAPSPTITAACSPDFAAPVQASDGVRTAVRDLLRHAGFKPTGRSKPPSEYLLKAASEGGLPAINIAVDVGNVVSLHSGLPISVIDAGRARGPFHISTAEIGSNFVFNRSGQVIDVSQLLCLHDADGPCANAVKDAQRTKTDADSMETLSIIWGSVTLTQHVDDTLRWYLGLLSSIDGAELTIVAPQTID